MKVVSILVFDEDHVEGVAVEVGVGGGYGVLFELEGVGGEDSQGVNARGVIIVLSLVFERGV